VTSRPPRISILDHGLGNIFSIAKAFEANQASTLRPTINVTTSRSDLMKADLIVLPGVGSFSKCVANLKKMRLFDILTDLALIHRTPVVGICLGMQLLFEQSDEGGKNEGLGWISGHVSKIQSTPSLKLPHIGWNIVSSKEKPFSQFLNEKRFYFLHSYRVNCHEDHVICSTDYGERLPAAVAMDNILGFQFHPEKSGAHGQRIIAETVNWALRKREELS
jgi:glutamine amidotransferase